MKSLITPSFSSYRLVQPKPPVFGAQPMTIHLFFVAGLGVEAHKLTLFNAAIVFGTTFVFFF